VKNHPPQRGGIFVERGCCGGAPQRGANRRDQIGQDLSAARFVLNAKIILHPAGVRYLLLHLLQICHPAGVKESFTSSGCWGIGEHTKNSPSVVRQQNLRLGARLRPEAGNGRSESADQGRYRSGVTSRLLHRPREEPISHVPPPNRLRFA